MSQVGTQMNNWGDKTRKNWEYTLGLHVLMTCVDDLCWWLVLMTCVDDLCWWLVLMTYVDDLRWWLALMTCVDALMCWCVDVLMCWCPSRILKWARSWYYRNFKIWGSQFLNKKHVWESKSYHQFILHAAVEYCTSAHRDHRQCSSK